MRLIKCGNVNFQRNVLRLFTQKNSQILILIKNTLKENFMYVHSHLAASLVKANLPIDSAVLGGVKCIMIINVFNKME